MKRLVYCWLVSSISLYYLITSFETKNEEGLVLLSSTVSRLYPKALSTYFIAGCVHHLKHELDTAEKYYCLLLETLPQSYLTWSMLGQVYDNGWNHQLGMLRKVSVPLLFNALVKGKPFIQLIIVFIII